MRIHLFGDVLETPVPVPGVEAPDGAVARWRLEFVETLAPTIDAVPVGFDPDPPCFVTLHRHSAGFRLQHVCTGEVDVLEDGRLLRMARSADVTDEAIAIDLIGRVLAIAMHAAGEVCLHASSVATRDGAIAFVAQKGTGKSTLAMALLRAGLPLLTDDSLRVCQTAGGPMANPGVHAVRLRDDSADAVDSSVFEAREAMDGKLAFDDLPHETRCLTAVPLAAVYVLAPQAPTVEQVATRERLNPIEAIQALIAHGKLGMLLGGAESGAQFDRLVTLAAQVPVYRLHIARDLARIGEVVEQIIGWHPRADVAAAVRA